MVMEGPPSPSSVGREFVRQYYTLLNKAPAHLHRFYNNQSSFVHGGLDPPHRETLPMIGQKQIHQKIQQLNFQDCHAKITQVDAQATLGSGVVVQVTGELSNAGQPMRRFTQTFVLAMQSPKKYYVHNDIFRYQDEIISDEECEGDVRSGDEGDGMPPQERPDLQPPPPQQQQQPVVPPPTMASYYQPQQPPQQPQQAQVQQVQQVQHQPHHVMPPQPVVQQQQPPPPQVQQVQQQFAAAVLQQQPPATINGAVHQEELMDGMQQTHSLPPMAATLVEHEQVVVAPPVVEEMPSVAVEEGAGDAGEVGKCADAPCGVKVAVAEVEVMQMMSEPVSNEPKTYANLLKSSSAPYTISGNVCAQTQPPKSVSPPPMKTEQRDRDAQFNAVNRERNHQRDQRNNGRLGGGGVGGPQPGVMRPADMVRPRGPRDSPADGGNYQSFGDDSGAGGKPKFADDRRRSQQGVFADSNQLFLGNLPLWASEDDLRDVFEKYGPVADLRILSKANSNKPGGVPGGRAPPNYGFITYESPAGVQACLESKPIMILDKSGNATTLNVEEKKIKERSSYANNMRNQQGGDNLSPRPPRDNNGPRRGGSLGGGGGQPRQPGGGPMGGGGGGGQRPNTFNRGGGSANRGGGGGGGGGPPNTYARR